MSRAPNPTAPKRAQARQAVKTVNLALQGGGSHGAYTWGVLDALAEDTRIEISAISGAERRHDERRRLRLRDGRGRTGGRPREAGEILALGLVGGLARAFRAQMG